MSCFVVFCLKVLLLLVVFSDTSSLENDIGLLLLLFLRLLLFVSMSVLVLLDLLKSLLLGFLREEMEEEEEVDRGGDVLASFWEAWKDKLTSLLWNCMLLLLLLVVVVLLLLLLLYLERLMFG